MESPHSLSPSSSSSYSSDGVTFDTEEPRTPLAVRRALHLINSGEPHLCLQAARDIRRLTKTSQRCRRQLSQAVGPLVSMLRVDSPESHESALLALLNLAVKDEKYLTTLPFYSPKIKNGGKFWLIIFFFCEKMNETPT